jgi:CrcB protein
MTREPHAERPAHLRVGYLALVALGGALGTTLREAISLLITPIGSFPVAIFGINIAGAFALGLVLQALALRGDDVGRRRHLRLLVGTGLIGGFTTYSALSADSAELLSEGGFAVAILYGLTTVILGGVASAAGIALGARLGARSKPSAGERAELPVDPDSTSARRDGFGS